MAARAIERPAPAVTNPPRRAIPRPRYADDGGAADPELVAALTAYRTAPGRGTATAVLVRLREVRLVVPVVAVAEPTAGDGEGSAMASVSIVGPRGERALVAFTGVPALVTWNAQARPVPASGRDVAMAALADGAALLVDPAGPVPFAVSGAELDLLAGRGPW